MKIFIMAGAFAVGAAAAATTAFAGTVTETQRVPGSFGTHSFQTFQSYTGSERLTSVSLEFNVSGTPILCFPFCELPGGPASPASAPNGPRSTAGPGPSAPNSVSMPSFIGFPSFPPFVPAPPTPPTPPKLPVAVYELRLEGTGAFASIQETARVSLNGGVSATITGSVNFANLADFTSGPLVQGRLSLAGVVIDDTLPFQPTAGVLTGGVTLTYNTTDIAPVPLPASLPLLGAAFGIAGGLLRRKRRRAAAT